MSGIHNPPSPTINIDQQFNDGIRLIFGSDVDAVYVLDNVGRAANAAFAGVLVGTPVYPNAIPPNSLVQSIVTADGDFVWFTNTGGNSIEHMRIDSSAQRLIVAATSGVMFALATGAPDPDASTVHIFKATGPGGVGIVDTVLMLENATNAYISFNSSGGQGLQFGDLNSNEAGNFLYQHSTNQFQWRIAGGLRLRYSSGVFAFQQATIISTTAGPITFSPASNMIMTRSLIVNDGFALILGSTADSYLVNRSTTLAPDGLITSIIEGTANHQGVAVNSLIVSTAPAGGGGDGDQLFLVSDGGNSLEMLRFDADVATADLGFGALITKIMATSTTRIEANGTGLGFFATTPAAQPTGVAVTAAGIHAALVTLGLITA